MNIFKRFVSGLGQQTAPFGFAPNDPNASYQAGLSYIGDIGANLMANNQGGVDPWANLGASIQQAKESSRSRNKESWTAQRLMEEAALKKQEREAEAQRKQQMEDAIAQLPADQQALARMLPDKFFGAQIDQQFSAPDLTTSMKDYRLAQEDPEYATFLDNRRGGGGGDEFGLQPVPLTDNEGKFVGFGQMSKSGGLFYNGQSIDGTDLRPMDPGSIAEARASGNLTGKAPEAVVDQYTTKIRPEMSGISDSLISINEAKSYLNKGIQTGSMAEKVQALRSLGSFLGFDVDENVLSDTQTYQNFIGSVVIPRMAALGGNDSNEELRKLYSLSGGDITQSLPALSNTLDFMDKLLRKKFKTLKASEDVALRYLPGLTPVDIGIGGGSAPVVIDGYTIEEE